MPAKGVLEDTICAIATPLGDGGIGIVRISGIKATEVAERVVRLRSQRSLQALPSHTLHLADFVHPQALPVNPDSTSVHTSLREQIIDEGLVVYMKAPRSFTAEDVVEIHCHGSGLVLQQVCEACLTAGARLAYPGEFTKRAFLNGRLDLSQAEAVLDTIKAKSEWGLRLAQRQLRGELAQQVNRLRGSLVHLLGNLEAGIDFSDEDITFIQREELTRAVEETLDEIRRMVETAETGRILRDGVRIVLVGKPNVGKSSLLNCLLREDRAIVTDIPGTTRDIIEGSVVWDGVPVTLVDTAGLHDTADTVEREGIVRSKEAQIHADMILHVLDAAELMRVGLKEFVFPSLLRQDLIVLNKTDLVDSPSLQGFADALQIFAGCQVLCLSVLTGVGLDALKDTIRSQFMRPSLESTHGLVVTRLRHRVALEQARASLTEAVTSIRVGREAEFVAVDLRSAADALGEIVGTITSDDVLERIFSEFCIGK